MGAAFVKAIRSIFNADDEFRIVMLGLDNAGKTTMLNMMHCGENLQTIPTVGFNFQSIKLTDGAKMDVWDVGGQERIRRLWHHYFIGTSGLIFVVDSADVARFDEALEELKAILTDDALRDVPVLLFANKQDSHGAKLPEDVLAHFNLLSHAHGRSWFVQGCVATRGLGVREGIEELVRMMRRRHK